MGRCMALDRRDCSYFRFAEDLSDSMLSSICCESTFGGGGGGGDKVVMLFSPQKSVFVYEESELKNL